MAKCNVKVGDTVLVISGKDAGKQGKVLKVSPADNKVVVAGVNLVSKTHKARSAQDKSEIRKQEGAISVSNVMPICPKCGKATRVAHAEVDGKKARVCKKCGASLDKEFVKEVKKATKDKTPKPEPAVKVEKETKKPAAKKATAKKETVKKETKEVKKETAKKTTKTSKKEAK